MKTSRGGFRSVITVVRKPNPELLTFPHVLINHTTLLCKKTYIQFCLYMPWISPSNQSLAWLSEKFNNLGDGLCTGWAGGTQADGKGQQLWLHQEVKSLDRCHTAPLLAATQASKGILSMGTSKLIFTINDHWCWYRWPIPSAVPETPHGQEHSTCK